MATFVAQKLGYDVKALPNLNNKNIADLSYNVSLAYLDKDGNHPKQESSDGSLMSESGKMYALRWAWKGRRSGHIVLMMNDGQGTYLYDPQTNTKYSGKAAYSFISSGHDFKKMDLTDCTIDEKFCDKIMKGVKKNG